MFKGRIDYAGMHNDDKMAGLETVRENQEQEES